LTKSFGAHVERDIVADAKRAEALGQAFEAKHRFNHAGAR
jgi:hypothetical protein